MLPFKQAIKLPLDVYHNIRFDNLSGRITLNVEKVSRGMVKFGAQGSDMFPRKGCILSIEGELLLHGSCVFGCSQTIMVRKDGIVEIGKGAIFGANNLLYAEDRVVIGEQFLSSWNCQIMDSDTHQLVNIQTGETLQSCKPIYIGRHCWFGNGVNVNKGSRLPDESVVASNSLLNSDFSAEDSHCVFAGSPAKVIKRNIKWSI